MQGTVKWFSSEKGYGFITSEDGEDHYFNVQSINGASLPSNGDSVQFESKSGNKGPRAINITITAKAPSQNTRLTDDRINCPSCGKKLFLDSLLIEAAQKNRFAPIVLQQ